MMKGLRIAILFIVFTPFLVKAQENTGTEVNLGSGTEYPIIYTRVNSQSGNEFVTLYKITKGEKGILEIEVSNEREMERMKVSIVDNQTGIGNMSYLSYERSEMGLVSINGNFLSVIDEEILATFDLVISFQDTTHSYATVNRIMVDGTETRYHLDPLSNFLINKHNKIIKQINDRKIAEEAAMAQQALTVQVEQEQKRAKEDSILKALDSLAVINEELRRKIDSATVMNERLMEIERQEKYRRDYYPYDTFSSKNRDAVMQIVDGYVMQHYLNAVDVKEFYFDAFIKIWIDTSGQVRKTELRGENSSNNSITRNYNALKSTDYLIRNAKLSLPVTYVDIYNKQFPVTSQTVVPFKVVYNEKSEKWVVNPNGSITPPTNDPLSNQVYNELVKMLSNPRAGKYNLKVAYITVNNVTKVRILDIN